MANRLLLTLLALMTGLAAQLSMGEARASQATSMQVATQREAPAAKAPRAPAELARLSTGRLGVALADGAAHSVAPLQMPTAPVLPGIDRARE